MFRKLSVACRYPSVRLCRLGAFTLGAWSPPLAVMTDAGPPDVAGMGAHGAVVSEVGEAKTGHAGPASSMIVSGVIGSDDPACAGMDDLPGDLDAVVQAKKADDASDLAGVGGAVSEVLERT
jgi:hypothetical protein